MQRQVHIIIICNSVHTLREERPWDRGEEAVRPSRLGLLRLRRSVGCIKGGQQAHLSNEAGLSHDAAAAETHTRASSSQRGISMLDLQAGRHRRGASQNILLPSLYHFLRRGNEKLLF
jgi:hypothetical protein